jgi:probable F420-dependent oxidoreductase
VARELSGVGLWAPLAAWEREGASAAATAAELERLGFEALWLGNGAGLLEQAERLLDATRRITVATGTAHLATHTPAALADAQARLSARHGTRFVLSVGGAWAPAADPDRPGRTGFARMVACLDALDRADPPVLAERRMLAALGPRMLELASQRACGAHPYTVPVEHTRLARRILGPDRRLVPEVKVVLERDPDRARAIARRTLGFYLDKGNYAANLQRLGFARTELTAGGTDRVVDALVAWGGPEAIRRRVDEHLRAGADQVALQLLDDEAGGRLPRGGYEQLAAALQPAAAA